METKWKKIDKGDVAFFVVLTITALLIVRWIFGSNITEYNTSICAINYTNGFMPAGFLGTVLLMCNKFAGGILMNYQGIFALNLVVMFLYVALLLLVFITAYLRTGNRGSVTAKQIICFASIFGFSMFCGGATFAGTGVYQMILVLIAMELFLCEKAEWLVMILSVIGICIQPDFFFLNLGMMLFPLAYKMKASQHRNYYKILFGMTLGTSIGMFAYSEYMTRFHLNMTADSQVSLMQQLSNNPNKFDVGNADFVFRNLSALLQDWDYAGTNYIELVLYIIFSLPFLVMFVKLLMGLRSRFTSYVPFILGMLLFLPQFLLKVHYGVIVYHFIMYVLLMVLLIYALCDEVMTEEVEKRKMSLKAKFPLPVLFLFYAMCFVRFGDISVSENIRALISYFIG